MSAERQEVINRIKALPDTAIVDLLEYLKKHEKELKSMSRKKAFSELEVIRKKNLEDNISSDFDEKVEYK